MPAMDNASMYIRDSNNRTSLKEKSGYEPSDTETDWDEPRNEKGNETLVVQRPRTPPLPSGRHSPLGRSGGRTTVAGPVSRRTTKSPYKRMPDDHPNPSPLTSARATSPYSRFKHPIYSDADEHGQQLPQSLFDDKDAALQRSNLRLIQRPTVSQRSKSTPKLRLGDIDDQIISGSSGRRVGRSRSPLARNPAFVDKERTFTSIPEIKEVVANTKLAKGLPAESPFLESTESFSQGDIFFSRNNLGMHARKINQSNEQNMIPKPNASSQRNLATRKKNQEISVYDQNQHVVSVSTLTSRTQSTSISAASREFSSKTSLASSKLSDSSGKSTGSFRKFTAGRQKIQKEIWFSCVKRGGCWTSQYPEKSKEIDEASFIEKALVVENLSQFMADKHRPGSLNGFICHKQQALQLKQLISHEECPNILLKGPYGSGKKTLSMAILREIFGSSVLKVSRELRCFHVEDSKPLEVVIPVTSSPHHVELNLCNKPENTRYALMALAKELTINTSLPEVSDGSFKADYKVIIIYEVDRLADNVQHLIKWIMDGYRGSCKLFLLCKDDSKIHESVKSRCKLVNLDAPVAHEIMEVLMQVARKENFDLPMSFAAKIAAKSKQNLRGAIMALEACKSHNYPFVDEQPIPLGWEEALIELAREILDDPSPKRQALARSKFQKLLAEFVHPKLILRKLVEQFLEGVDSSLKRELYYWHAYYDKRLPTGTSAVLKLEEFVAKFIGIYRKTFTGV